MNDAYSTLVDALLFLVLVSIASGLLLPAVVGTSGVSALSEARAPREAGSLLGLVVNTRLDGARYRLGGPVVEPLAGAQAPVGPLVEMVVGREVPHPTVGDLLVDAVSSEFRLANGSASNPLTSDLRARARVEAGALLRAHAGGRYRYRLEVEWRPLRGRPPLGLLEVGDRVPVGGSVVAQAPLSLPWVPRVTETVLEGPPVGWPVDLSRPRDSLQRLRGLIENRGGAPGDRGALEIQVGDALLELAEGLEAAGIRAFLPELARVSPEAREGWRRVASLARAGGLELPPDGASLLLGSPSAEELALRREEAGRIAVLLLDGAAVGRLPGALLDEVALPWAFSFVPPGRAVARLSLWEARR
ncbi:MAG: hypothetical protein HY558_05135 [Euryarchaeota archaeon]|nr:hypothetical protein [Euryarchaeota archaeon]